MQQYILLTPDQLQTLIENSIRKIFSEQNLLPKEEEAELLNATDAARFVGIAKQTLYGYTSRRLIPFIKRGAKTVLFRRSDLQSWLMEGKKATIAENNKKLDDTLSSIKKFLFSLNII